MISEPKLYTIGHSTNSTEEFIQRLQDQQITQLVDIRTVPKSRHNPQFGEDQLPSSLKQQGIDYVYLKSLGGLRPAAKSSIDPNLNGAWRNQSFRNYADYMQTDEFQQGLDELIALASQQTSAIMCAEILPWRCHRSLVADSLTVAGFQVYEIINNRTQPHQLTSFAVVQGRQVTYPDPEIKID